MSIDGQPQQVPLTGEPTWDAGVTSAKAFKARPETKIEVADVGDFEHDQPFTCSVWVKVPAEKLTGAIVARMDDANAYRGWDLWLENGRPASHIVHNWPDDALKVVSKTALKPNQWQYVTISYDGSGSAGGLKIYIDGESQNVDLEANTLKDSIRTTVPLKLAQRNTSARVDDLAMQDLRMYGRAVAAGRDFATARHDAGGLSGLQAGRRTCPERDRRALRLVAGLGRSVNPQLTAAKSDCKPPKPRSSLGPRSRTSCRRRSDDAMAFVLFRGEYDKRRDEVKPDTPSCCRPFPPTCRAIGWDWPSGCCGPNIR